jgi:hypothetical protein
MVNFILPPVAQSLGAQTPATQEAARLADGGGAQAGGLPDLGAQAVTAATKGKAARHDPGPLPPARPLPAPIKGLGVWPLDTREVGDQDRPDEGAGPALDLRR